MLNLCPCIEAGRKMRDDNWSSSDERFPTTAFERTKNAVKRRWTCPGDETIAAYVDGALREHSKTRVEAHLAKCEGCRSVVADVVKLSRDAELPTPPLAAGKNPSLVLPRTSTRSAFLWGTAVAMAAIVLIAAIIVLRREPWTLALSSPPVPSAPLVRKPSPPTADDGRVYDITRQPRLPSLAPVIVSPRQDSIVERDQLQFTWKALERSRYYEVSVVTSDGDLLWSGRTQTSSLRLPRRVVLKPASYFVWVTAYLVDGQVARSSATKFVVDR